VAGRSLVALVALVFQGSICCFIQAQGRPLDGASEACLDCDRQTRKVFEALQAWRRMHGGNYPDSLIELAKAGLIKPGSIHCPTAFAELRNASSEHQLSQSRREDHDPPGAYEYELSSVADKVVTAFMGEEIPRRRIKSELLRRPFREQVPILRCSAHGEAKPPLAQPSNVVFRNLTASGLSYWSGAYWELEWRDVPMPCRHAIVVKGFRGPPFHSGTAPEDPRQIDLQPFYNARGERPWWWGLSYFVPGQVLAPDLSELLQEGPARVQSLGGESYWLDGLIQLQGKTSTDGSFDKAYALEMFPWRTPPISIGRPIQAASVLLGCIWEDLDGREVGSLVWRYADGTEKRTPFIYGESLRRFWKTGSDNHRNPGPAYLSKGNRHAQVRIYGVRCENPTPSQPVTSLTVESNRESPAAPFILAISVQP
jgi:hypothetical protein